MPVFSKGLLCTRTGNRPGRAGRHGCLGGSDEDDVDDSPEVGNSSAVPPADQEGGSVGNTEFETGQSDLPDGAEEDFRFLLTLADRQFPEEERPEQAPLVEFENAEFAEPPPQQLLEVAPLQSQPQRRKSSAVAAKKPQPPKRVVAKSSCGKATSDEETITSEEEPSVTVAAEPPLPQPAQLQTQQLTPMPDEDAEGEDELLVLLPGLPPPDDFRFFLTVHQVEVAH